MHEKFMKEFKDIGLIKLSQFLNVNFVYLELMKELRGVGLKIKALEVVNDFQSSLETIKFCP